MIIPPDPEKDPNLFTPADSTPSLLLSPSERDVRHPEATHPHPRQGYGYVYGEWSGEQLPPYERRRASREAEGDVFSDRQEVRERNLLPILTANNTAANARVSRSFNVTPLDTSLPLASTSAQTLPSASASPLDPNASTSKLWESSGSRSKEGRKGKMKAALTPSPDIRDCWTKYRKWIIGVIILILVGLGIMTGLLVGLRVGVDNADDEDQSAFSPWHDIDGKKTNTQWAPDGSMNLTYTQSRDGPSDSDGNSSYCNQFTPVNTTDFSLLSIPYPASSLSVSTFTFPLADNTNSSYLKDFFIQARGLGSSGTIEFVGGDYPSQIMQGGNDNELRVDVVLRYGGPQDPMTTVNVCQMEREDGSSGIGIYTPTETDGKVTNVYMLEPTTMPSFQIVIRLPPAAYAGALANPLWLDSFTVDADRLNMIIGDLSGILTIGRFSLTTARGSFYAGNLVAQEATIYSSYNDVRGTFNISESLLVNVTEGSISADVVLTNDVSSHVDDLVNNLDTSGVVFPSSSASTSVEDWWTQSTSATASSATESSESSAGCKRSRLSVPASTAGNVSLEEAVFNAAVNATPLTSINTTFTTTSGSVQVTYLNHPPRTALTSLVVSASGGVNVVMHPTFVGPFAVRNVWGEVRLPQFDNEDMQDPLDGGRTRGMSLGPINVPPASLFAEGGVNTTNLPFSGTTITGAAYWYFASNDTGSGSGNASARTHSYTTQKDYPQYPQQHRDYQPGWSGTSTDRDPVWPIAPVDVQSSEEGRDSQLMVLGAYGDVRVTFDGT